MLHAELGVRLGSLTLDVELDVADGEVVALLGPNGSGKTTTLRTIAGLQPLDAGRVVIDGRPVDDPRDALFVPPHQRPIGFVFQDYLLFPNLNVADNVAFGLRARGVAKDAARLRAIEWLEQVGLEGVATSRPAALSGGQAQRVALVRALAIEPRLLLLDEPLAALDAQVRLQVRTDLRRHLAGFPGGRLLVTHDPVDALVLADRLVILDAGRVCQTGTPAEVTAHPGNRYVADLLGVNLLDGVASGERSVRLDSGNELVVADALPASRVAITIRPQAVSLHRHHPEGSPRNVWEATVGDLHPDRGRVRVVLEGPVPLIAEVTPAAVSDLGLRPGSRVWATVKAVDLSVYAR